jgi:hypothetical protein
MCLRVFSNVVKFEARCELMLDNDYIRAFAQVIGSTFLS